MESEDNASDSSRLFIETMTTTNRYVRPKNSHIGIEVGTNAGRGFANRLFTCFGCLTCEKREEIVRERQKESETRQDASHSRVTERKTTRWKRERERRGKAEKGQHDGRRCVKEEDQFK